ncbi:hypothetical protein R69658_05658 [Paraburkholderia aspalathi]|uniref:Uncharacterized protein n=1 Tax=Paraburkholderia aspalathi TaxID=1324617 RepID=A0ABN7MMK8_9BURK|nr:hypothetical protein R69658_05658 [Paraburkholderia aspalathi]
MNKSLFRHDRLPSVLGLLRLLGIRPVRTNESGYPQVDAPIPGEGRLSTSIHVERST